MDKRGGLLGTLAGLVSLFLAFYFYHNPKDMNDNILTIKLLNLSTILQKSDKELPKFNVAYSYDGKPVSELYFAEFIILNTSYNDITEKDFFEPLQFSTNAEILDISIENSKKCKLQIAEREKHKIIFSKDTFKEGEYIKVKLFLDSSPTIDFSENNILNLNNKDIEVEYTGRDHRPVPKFPIGGWYHPEKNDGWPRWQFRSWLERDIVTDK